jgi:hypothetical protein
MGCCGEKRQQWQQSEIDRQEPMHSNAKAVMENMVKIRYNGKNTAMVKGIETGFLYIFAPGESNLGVDGRDVQQILSVSEEFTLTKY